MRSLEAYVQVELNVRSVRALSISDAAGLVSLKCLPNHTKLAKGLGAAYKTLQKSIRELSHAQLTGYMQTGKPSPNPNPSPSPNPNPNPDPNPNPNPNPTPTPTHNQAPSSSTGTR